MGSDTPKTLYKGFTLDPKEHVHTSYSPLQSQDEMQNNFEIVYFLHLLSKKSVFVLHSEPQ